MTEHSLTSLSGYGDLEPENRALLRSVLRNGPQDPVWRARVLSEAAALLLLSQRAGPERLRIGFIEAPDALRALLFMGVPVACRPAAEDSLEIAPQATIGLSYAKEAVLGPMPGLSFIQVISPLHVWHPNVATPGQVVCLGPSLPSGIRVTELIYMTYGALSMQTVQLDEGDPAGVLNPAAAAWWQLNRHRIPLSRAPFLRPRSSGA